MMYMDPTYILLVPGMLVSVWAQYRVQSVTHRYSHVYARCGLTGAELAARILQDEGIDNVSIERISRQLTDHYDPSSRTLRLSASVADSTSLTALGVAAHETGHALQHRDAYRPLVLRTAVVPTVNLGSNLSWPLFLLGLFWGWQPLVNLGIIFFLLTVLFTLITLPVEFNASQRAMTVLSAQGYLQADELNGAEGVLRAAAMTYVAAALTAILQLLRLLALSGRRRRH